MSILTCPDTRRVLNAYHDGELTMDQQVAVQSHLRGCAGCRAERRRLRDIGTLLRAGASRVRQEPGRLERHVLARLYVERQLSWRGRLNRLFEDLHLVWAAAGATAATIAVVCSAVGMMQLTFQEQPASMAALIEALSTPGSNRNPVTVDGRRMLLPRFDPDAVVGALLDGEEGVFALAAVVTREGRVRNLELLTYGGAAISMPHADVLQLLDAASQARFEPARAGGSPVAVSMIWLVAHTTVRGKVGEAWPILHAPVRPSPPAAMPVSELPSRTSPAFA